MNCLVYLELAGLELIGLELIDLESVLWRIGNKMRKRAEKTACRILEPAPRWDRAGKV